MKTTCISFSISNLCIMKYPYIGLTHFLLKFKDKCLITLRKQSINYKFHEISSNIFYISLASGNIL